MSDLEKIQDKEAIRILTVHYSRAVDSKDWPLYRSVFLDKIHVDFGDYARVGEWSADDWVDNIQQGIYGFDSTQHLNGNHEIIIDGDRASSTHYVLAEHCIYPEGSDVLGNDDAVTVGGYYHNEYQRTADGWKISSIVFTGMFLKGNPELFGKARQA